MVFNSLTFLLFFAVVLAVHALPLPWTFRKINLLLASYVFYAAWNPPFVLLLIVAAIMDFGFAHALAKSNRVSLRRFILVLSLTVNLGLLGFFKYSGLIMDTFSFFARWWGVTSAPKHFDILLPLGISFYTFETTSYLIDVYRRRIEPTHSFIDYALFLTFFPHLVAGPIVRARDFLPQCRTPRTVTRDQFSWGLILIIIGLFEKVILADGVFAPIADPVFNAAGTVGRTDAWAGLMAFSGQIYFDFAGYSTCGIGAALCLGFALTDNFHFPYGAVGFSDFWKRWHISLSTWLRDYLYIPLGGSQSGKTYRNLMLTMLLGGLWHGAAWRFVAWGGLHGAYLIIERAVKHVWGARPSLQNRSVLFVFAAMTFVIVSISWVFFRAESFAQSWALLSSLVSHGGSPFILKAQQVKQLAVAVVAMLSCQWALRNTTLEQVWQRLPWWAGAAVMAVLVICLVYAPGDDRAFIYFQF